MSNKLKYFKTLGIEPTSNKSVIKKAYRKLAFKYHPDKNHSPEAESLFIELTEAYEIAIGLKQPANNINKSKSNQPSQKSAEEQRHERVKAAKERYKKAKQKEIADEVIYFNSLITGFKWKIIKWISITGILTSLLLTTDYFLPVTKKTILLEYYYTEARSNYIEVNINNSTYYFNKIVNPLLNNNPLITAVYTPIFNDLKHIEITNYNTNIINKKPFFTFTSLFPLISIILLIPIATFKLKRKSILFSLSHMLSLYIIPFLILILLFSNWRIFQIFM